MKALTDPVMSSSWERATSLFLGSDSVQCSKTKVAVFPGFGK